MAIAETPPVQAHETTPLAACTQQAFWWRAVALLVDLMVIGVADSIANAVFGVDHLLNWTASPAGGLISYTATYGVDALALTLIWMIYFAFFEVLFGATPGKLAARLRVTDLDGRLPALRAILIRDTLRWVDSLPALYLLGGLVALASPLRQRIGDRLARTLIVPRYTLAAPLLTPTQLRRRLALVGVVVAALLASCGGFFYFGRPPLVIQSMVNTRQMMFRDGVSSYSLSAPAWGSGTVTYRIHYTTSNPYNTCDATLTLRWAQLSGWQPGYGQSACAHHTP